MDAEILGSITTQVVTWALVVLGWVVVSGGNDKREQRKEIRTLINEISSDLNSLHTMCVNYYTSAPGGAEESLSIQIKTSIDAIEKKVNLLARQNRKFSITSKVVRLRRVATGNTNFESSARVSLNYRDRLFLSIYSACQNIRDGLEQEFITSYCKKVG